MSSSSSTVSLGDTVYFSVTVPSSVGTSRVDIEGFLLATSKDKCVVAAPLEAGKALSHDTFEVPTRDGKLVSVVLLSVSPNHLEASKPETWRQYIGFSEGKATAQRT